MPDTTPNTTPVKPVRTALRTVTTRLGRTFAVRVVPHGARYGRGNCLVNAEQTMVEFYDTTYADDGFGGVGDGFGPLGQFVSRYLVTSLTADDDYRDARRGLCLHGGSPEVWTVDAATMRDVVQWLDSHVTDADREHDRRQAEVAAKLRIQLDARRANR